MRVIGYVFDQPNNKYKDKYYFEYSLINLFKFINDHKNYDIRITTIDDEVLVDVNEGFIVGSGFSEEYILNSFLPAIAYFQENEIKEKLEFIEIEPGIVEEKE